MQVYVVSMRTAAGCRSLSWMRVVRMAVNRSVLDGWEPVLGRSVICGWARRLRLRQRSSGADWSIAAVGRLPTGVGDVLESIDAFQHVVDQADSALLGSAFGQARRATGPVDSALALSWAAAYAVSRG